MAKAVIIKETLNASEIDKLVNREEIDLTPPERPEPVLISKERNKDEKQIVH